MSDVYRLFKKKERKKNLVVLLFQLIASCLRCCVVLLLRCYCVVRCALCVDCRYFKNFAQAYYATFRDEGVHVCNIEVRTCDSSSVALCAACVRPPSHIPHSPCA